MDMGSHRGRKEEPNPRRGGGNRRESGRTSDRVWLFSRTFLHAGLLFEGALRPAVHTLFTMHVPLGDHPYLLYCDRNVLLLK